MNIIKYLFGKKEKEKEKQNYFCVGDLIIKHPIINSDLLLFGISNVDNKPTHYGSELKPKVKEMFEKFANLKTEWNIIYNNEHLN